MYKWHQNGNNACDALIKMKPCLIVKAEQAELGIKFQTIVKNRHRRLNIENIDLEKQYYDKMREFKKREWDWTTLL